ncbi:MAG TPA: adenosine kinase [Rickettsiales bacterium]|nr:adenosine kinase [Rickettsiales bacterium]
MPENIAAKFKRAGVVPAVEPKKYDVVAIGRADTDVIAEVSERFLQENGIPPNAQKDCSADEVRTLQASLGAFQIQAGGATANSMAVVSALGGRAGFFGKVCDDDKGKVFLNDFRRRSVDVCCPPYSNESDISSTCLVLLNGKNRSFAYAPGASEDFSAQDFSGFDFNSTHFCLVEGDLLTGVNTKAKPAVMEAMKQAEGKCRIAVNLQNILDWSGHEDVLHYILQHADVVIGNEEEQAAFFAAKKSSPEKAGQMVITTRGENGADVSVGNRILHVLAAPPQEFVSSVGAGDAFTAAFLLGQARGLEVDKCARLAVRVASKVIEEYGARPTRPLQHYFPDFKSTEEAYARL